MIIVQQESLIAKGIGLSIKDGVIGFANAKFFGITDDPQAGAIYSLFRELIHNAIFIPHVYFLREEIMNAVPININMDEMIAKYPDMVTAITLYYIAISTVSILGGRYLANRYYQGTTVVLSYRQVAALEFVRLTERLAFGI